ncbi:MAG: protease TldD [Methanosaeta sp. PtaU1.Bin028]|nr:MAG: protease TldD [Methanosaeta sp. PtaU1.Bin028]
MADFYDIRTVKGQRTSIVLDNSKVEEVADSYFQGAAVRSLLNGAWGFVKTDSLDGLDSSLEASGRLARSIGRQDVLELAEISPGRSMDLPMARDTASLSLEEKVEILREVEKRARLPGIKSTQAFYFESHSTVGYRNSEGLSLSSSFSRTGFGITAVAAREGLLQSGSEIRAGVGGLEIMDRDDPLLLAEKAAKTAIELLDARVPKGGRYPVILDQELGGVFIHEAVGHGAEGDIVLEGGSILEGKMGQAIGSELVTVKDDPSLPYYGHYPFDEEGAEARETVILDRGVLRSYLHSRETASRLGGSSRNARAQGYSEPHVRMSNTYVANGDRPFDELLEELHDGIYLLGSRGGQVNPAEGVFQFNAKRGYLVEKGEITSLLRDVSLSGQTLEILRGVRAIGNDLKFNSGGCGKSGQTVPVGDGAPHMLIGMATVGGAG